MTVSRVTMLFPLWALLLSVLAYLVPGLFVGMAGAIVPGLGVIMFGMGLTLTAADFRRVVMAPMALILGLVLQVVVMPAGAWLAALVTGLDPLLLAGLVLVGVAPVGTAASVVVYLARGDVALTVTLTVLSTLVAKIALPLLTLLYSGEQISLPADALLADIVEIVVLPVAAGTVINMLLGRRIAGIRAWFPLLSVVAICSVIAIIVALTADSIAAMTLPVVIAVILLNVIGLGVGYGVPALFGMERRICRTLAIAVGMQNSGLSVALAVKFLAPGAALPGALFSIWHNLSGALLAGHWSRADDRGA